MTLAWYPPTLKTFSLLVLWPAQALISVSASRFSCPGVFTWPTFMMSAMIEVRHVNVNKCNSVGRYHVCPQRYLVMNHSFNLIFLFCR